MIVSSTRRGPEASLRIIRPVNGDNLIFRYAAQGNNEGVRELLAKRSASPFDITNGPGLCVLNVWLSFCFEGELN